MASPTGIRIEPLRKDNYDTWCIQAQALLIRSALWEYVSDEKKRPETSSKATQWDAFDRKAKSELIPVSYTHLRAHETPEHLVCRLLLEKKKKKTNIFE